MAKIKRKVSLLQKCSFRFVVIAALARLTRAYKQRNSYYLLLIT